jgi:hypothetical protein
MTPTTSTRTWTLLIPAPAPLWSSNDSHRRGPRATSANRVLWRKAAYESAQKARLPKALTRVRFAITFHFQDRLHRDALNYAETAKPVVDAFGPPFLQAPTPRAPRGKSAPGWGLIPDDTPKHLESTALAIGPLWRDVLTDMDPVQARLHDTPYGGLTVVITDLT